MPVTPDESGERLRALGLVIERSAIMEQQVRAAFSELAGSTVAAALAADQPVGWLIASCEALAEARQELPEADRKTIRDALRGCEEAGQRRIDLERSLQTAGRPPWTTGEIAAAGEELEQAGRELAGAIRQALQTQPGPPQASSVSRQRSLRAESAVPPGLPKRPNSRPSDVVLHRGEDRGGRG